MSLNLSTILLIILYFLNNSNAYYLRKNESQIETCEDEFSVCNLVHDRYWMSNLIEKFCKCPGETFCPVTYQQNDEYAINVNARTQMKFCQPVQQLFDQLKRCEKNETSLSIRTIYQLDLVRNSTVSILCSCWDQENFGKKFNYWQFISRSGESIDDESNLFEIVDKYQCTDLPKCEANEFCGFARLDLGFVFQRCTCSDYFKCGFETSDDDIMEDIDELFYHGPVFKSKCVPEDEDEFW